MTLDRERERSDGSRRRPVAPVYLLTAVALLVVPPLVFSLVGLAEGMGVAGTAAALVAQYGASRQNLLVLGAVGLLPLLLLSLAVYLVGRFTSIAAPSRGLALGGAVPLLAVTVWVNARFWPLFLPGRTYPGFPHGLEFVIGPLVFAPVAMLVGVVAAALVYRSRTAP